MNIDMLIDGILDSYDRYGLINRNHTEDFPNRQNVVSILSDIQAVVFPGFRAAEDIDSVNIRYVIGQKVNNIIANLTREIQKALIYTKAQTCSHEEIGNISESHCFKLAEKTSIALIEEIPEIRRQIQLDVIATFNGDPAAKSNEEVPEAPMQDTPISGDETMEGLPFSVEEGVPDEDAVPILGQMM